MLRIENLLHRIIACNGPTHLIELLSNHIPKSQLLNDDYKVEISKKYSKPTYLNDYRGLLEEDV